MPPNAPPCLPAAARTRLKKLKAEAAAKAGAADVAAKTPVERSPHAKEVRLLGCSVGQLGCAGCMGRKGRGGKGATPAGTLPRPPSCPLTSSAARRAAAD